jgi:hypothetical protein
LNSKLTRRWLRLNAHRSRQTYSRMRLSESLVLGRHVRYRPGRLSSVVLASSAQSTAAAAPPASSVVPASSADPVAPARQ